VIDKIKMKIKPLVKNCLPHGLLKLIQKKAKNNVFKGQYTSWREASAQCTGYDSERILAKVLSGTLKVINGEAAYERDSVTFRKIEYSWPVISSLLRVAAKHNGRLNVLDFGGSLGSSFFQNIGFLKDLNSLRWNIVEQTHYVEAGKKHVQTQQLRFYRTIDDCLEENQPNVVLLSSVLQYIEDPVAIIQKIKDLKAVSVIIDRTPFSNFEEDKLFIQTVPSSIYSASYPMRVFSLSKFSNMIKPEWEIVAHFFSAENTVPSSDGLGFSFRGMLIKGLK